MKTIYVPGKYFKYKKGNFELTGKRPTNQNLPSVQQKIAARLKKLIEDNPELELTKLQKLFVNEISKNKKVKLRKRRIDIAHYIAISVLMQIIVDVMNNPSTIQIKNIQSLNQAIISTDSPDSEQKINDFFEDLKNKNISPREKISQANKVAERWNRASKNLIPGHSSTNRALSNNIDLHLLLWDGRYTNTSGSIKINKAYNKVGFYSQPKTRVNASDEIEYQSSSIHSNPKKAWSSVDLIQTSSSEESSETADSICSDIFTSQSSCSEESFKIIDSDYSNTSTNESSSKEESSETTDSDTSYYSPSFSLSSP